MQLHESTVRQDAKTPGRGQSTRRDSRRGAWPAARQQKGAVPRREPRATGPVEFFTRSRRIGTTSINRANANAVSKSQKPHFTSRQSCGGYRVKKLGGSPSSRPRRRPAVALPLPRCLTDAPPLPSRCPVAFPLLPRCLAAVPLPRYSAASFSFLSITLLFPHLSFTPSPPKML